MKITISQLRRIIKEEVEAVSEGGFKDVYGDDVDSPAFKEKLASKKAVMVPSLEKKKPEVSVGKKRGEYDFNELVSSLSPEQQAELQAALAKLK